jgi:hypothetical protein
MEFTHKSVGREVQQTQVLIPKLKIKYIQLHIVVCDSSHGYPVSVRYGFRL